MKAAELRQLTLDELASRLDDLKSEQFNLRFQQVSGQIEDVSRIKQTRRDIARVYTIIREKELEADNAE